MRSSRAGLAALAACLAAGGCVEGRPEATSSMEEARVVGRVTVLGKPATAGRLTFDPSNVNRPGAALRTFPIGPDGGYEATTLVGPNSVSVSVDEPRAGDGTAAEFGLEVKPGGDRFDVSLPKTVD